MILIIILIGTLIIRINMFQLKNNTENTKDLVAVLAAKFPMKLDFNFFSIH